ncbi:hypothetical protein BTK97_005259 [Burkholderia multivorans]|nr:hypothetical protein [Burkholderia multivorans]
MATARTPRNKQRVDIEVGKGHWPLRVYIDSIDVSLSRLIVEIKNSPHWAALCEKLAPYCPYVQIVPIRVGTPGAY